MTQSKRPKPDPKDPSNPSPQYGKSYPREVPSTGEIHAMLDETAGRSPTARRNYALLSFLFGTGARINEALEVHPADLSFERKQVYLRVTKNNKPRHAAMSPDAIEACRRWLETRGTLGLPGDAPLFCTLKGTKMHDQYVRQMMQRLAERANWTTRPHPHALRHAHAAMIAKTWPANRIMKQLGHASLATTSAYVDSITADDLTESMEGVSWE
jgi:integrase/recombinase XerD